MKASILVVGGAGYIGSHMVKRLIEENYQVIVLDNLSTGCRQLVRHCRFIEGRLGDSMLLDSVFEQYAIDAVMHFAAFSIVGESVQHPLKYFRNNISETVALVKAMVRHDVRRFIFSSSAAVYGEPRQLPIAEDHPCHPRNPYGDTKLSVEQLLGHCDSAYGVKSVCLRYFNAAGADPSGTIGEMHSPETHLIPIILQCALSGRAVRVFGTDYPTSDGTCIRDYVHVCDIAQAHLLALEALMSGCPSTVYNLGSSVGYSVKEVIEAAQSIVGRPIDVITEARRPGDPGILVADAAKIKRELGWRPQYEDLARVIETAWKWENSRYHAIE